MNLSQIASISSGINERKNPQGSIYYLGGSDFIAPHALDPLLEPSLMPSSKLEKHFLNKGDVLILSKGHHGFVAHSYQAIKQPAVASSIFMVLRDIASSVLPEYVAWYINLKTTQKELINFSRGSALPAINKKILSELAIEVPDLKTQKTIVAIDQLKKQESILTKQLDNLKTIQLEILLKHKIQS